MARKLVCLLDRGGNTFCPGRCHLCIYSEGCRGSCPGPGICCHYRSEWSGPSATSVSQGSSVISHFSLFLDLVVDKVLKGNNVEYSGYNKGTM